MTKRVVLIVTEHQLQPGTLANSDVSGRLMRVSGGKEAEVSVSLLLFLSVRSGKHPEESVN